MSPKQPGSEPISPGLPVWLKWSLVSGMILLSSAGGTWLIFKLGLPPVSMRLAILFIAGGLTAVIRMTSVMVRFITLSPTDFHKSAGQRSATFLRMAPWAYEIYILGLLLLEGVAIVVLMIGGYRFLAGFFWINTISVIIN